MKNFLASLKTGFSFLKNNLVFVLLAVAVLFFFLWKIEKNKANNNETKYETELKYRKALTDSIHVYKNKEGEWVAEKKTLQESVSFLEKNIGDLSSSQKELLARIKNVEKSNTIIAAALIKTTVIIDSLNNVVSGIVDTTKNTITFKDSIPNLKFDFTAERVKPVNSALKPMLSINKIELPNTQFIEFHWKNEKKEGYPISFSVSNSNKYFKTYDINSYAIPELDKPTIKPNGWQKIGKWFKKNSEKVLYTAVGVAATVIVIKAL